MVTEPAAMCEGVVGISWSPSGEVHALKGVAVDGTCVLIASHDPQAVEHAGQVLRLVDGRLGSATALLRPRLACGDRVAARRLAPVVAPHRHRLLGGTA